MSVWRTLTNDGIIKSISNPKKAKNEKKKKNNTEQRPHLLGFHVSSLGAFRHKADMAAGLLGLLINLGTYWPRKPGVLRSSSHSDCVLVIMDLVPHPLQPYLCLM